MIDILREIDTSEDDLSVNTVLLDNSDELLDLRIDEVGSENVSVAATEQEIHYRITFNDQSQASVDLVDIGLDTDVLDIELIVSANVELDVTADFEFGVTTDGEFLIKDDVGSEIVATLLSRCSNRRDGPSRFSRRDDC